MGLTWQEAFILTTTLVLLVQGLFFSSAMLYSWKDPSTLLAVAPPRLVFGKPRRKFSLLVPARFEEGVIKQTILACSRINYPKDQYEVIVITRNDDPATKEKVVEAMRECKDCDVRLLTCDELPINKSKSLNAGLFEAKYPLVGVFDAEDEPHPDLLTAIDTFLDQNPGTDVVQSGVQLVNVASTWFSAIACLEYYFWFKSVLPLFSFLGSTPLGGNTVFFKKYALLRVGGWDEYCLTEDAEIGMRLAAAGFRIRMIYDGALATLEETPPSSDSFVRQRTRWIQGYLQTAAKGYWAKQKSPAKRWLSLYLLLQPAVHEILAIAFVVGPAASLFMRAPLILTYAAFLPLFFLALQMGSMIIGLAHLKRNHRLNFPRRLYLQLVASYFPYQFLITFSFVRAVKRILTAQTGWEKTVHYDLHRQFLFGVNVAAGI